MKRILQILTVIALPFMATGQSPGGVGTPVVWLKAEQGVTTSGSTVNAWTNTGSSGGSAGQLGRTSTTTWALPEFSANVHNFNPAIIDNSSTNDGSLLLADIFPSSTHRALSSFVLYSNTNVAQENNMIAFTPLKLTTGALEAPYLGSTGNNNLWFFWEGIYQTNPALPNSITRQNNIPSVNAYYVPQWINSSTPHKTSMSMNGATTLYPGIGLINAASRPFGNQLFIFGDGNSNNGNAGGKVSEIITYDRDLNATEKQQINSYLSIKYGISLTTDDGSAVPNYLNSTAAIVWNSTTNSGYNNNIAGIANDSGSGLNQKQSQSVNTGQKLIIGNGSSLFNTNALNTNNLSDGQFLIVGDNGQKQSPSVLLNNPAAGGGATNYRFGSIWKVQNTNNVGPVTIAWPSDLSNLHLVLSGDPTIDTSDTFIPMSGTTIVNGVAYNTANVTLTNGQYFTFAAYIHAPGGVISSLWYRADKGLVPSTGAVSNWTDFSAGQVTVTPTLSSLTSAPLAVTGTGLNFNFNPGITFTALNALGNTATLNPTSGPNYTVYTSSTAATGDRIVGLSYTNLSGGFAFDSPGIGADVTGFRNAAGTIVMSTAVATGFKYTQFTNTTIARNTFTNNEFTRALNGNAPGANFTYSNTTTGPNGGIIFGRNANNGGDDAGSALTMSETIVFDGVLSTNDINRVDSYLAIKGGITLDANTPNYLSSASAIVWSRSLNTGYNNNIFGIANDFTSALHQKQSKSINTEQNLIIGAGGALANTNTLNTNTLSDGQFLIVGDNGLKQGLVVPISGITGVNYRFESIWKAQNTGAVGTVRVAWPSGLTSLRLIQSPDAVFDNTDTVTDMSVNTQTVNGVTYNYADVTMANGQYFTFAAFAYAPGGVINGLSQWYRADIDATNTGNGSDVSSWRDIFSGTVSSQIASKVLPKFKFGEATYFNYNPGVNFTEVNQTLGNISTQTITNTSNDIFTVTKEEIASPGSPNPHFFSITANNATTDASSWDYVGFFPNATIERRVVNGGTQLPNSGVNFSTTIPSIMYNTFTNTTLARGLNGAANAGTVNTAAMGLALGGHVFGDTRWTGNNSDNGGFIGNIGETIIYGGGNITAAERRKVDTYLAIKYGITLGRLATDNYISSADAIVWNGALNTTYNNNVFGLAKDDISAFHQKVSKSVNSGTILTMATNNDFVSQNTTASRAALSGDQKYFLTGDNTVTTTPLVGFTVSGNPAQRIQRIWLSQRTNTLGNIYFAADLSAYGTGFAAGNNIRMFVADDAAFTTNVQSVAGTFTGGKWVFNKSFDSDAAARYITFGIEPQPQVLWVRADIGVNTASGVPADNTQLTTWFDQETANGSQNGGAATTDPGETGETSLPTLPFYKYNATDNFNFNPVVEFSNLNRGNAVQFTTPTFGSQTVISVFKAAGFGNQYFTNMLLYGGDISNPSSGDPAPIRADMSFGVSAGSLLSFGGGSSGDYSYVGNLGLQTLPAIGTLKRDRIGDEEIYYSSYGNGSNDILNQNADPTNTRTGEGRLLSGLVRIGKHFSSPIAVNDPIGRLNGSYAELIVYDRVLTEQERARVESYLAVKYGITLTGGTDQYGGTLGNINYDYVNSSGTVVRTSDATYRYDVFGLGRDDFYTLNQRISKSSNIGDILTVSTNTDFTSLNLDAARTAINGDQEFMLFANNRGSANAVVEQVTELPANVQRRLDREWKVAQANTDGTNIPNVSLRFNLAGVTLTGITATNVALLIDSDGDGDFTTGSVQQIPASSYTAGSAVSFSNVALTNGQVFTLGIAQDVCYKPGAVATVGNPALDSKVGITSLGRAGADNENWPMLRSGGWIALESKTKGFVLNRVAFTDADSNPSTPDVPTGISAANFVEGMMVYDTTAKCLKIYTSTDNGSTFAWRCMTTQTCPD